MKPKNFPGRKNQRRLEAVERLRNPSLTNNSNRLNSAKKTEDKIISQEEAVSTKTKKFRG